MKNILAVIHIVVSLILIILIVLQTQGKGLSSTWGGSDTSYHSKRGMDKIIFSLTIAMATVFFISALAAFLSF